MCEAPVDEELDGDSLWARAGTTSGVARASRVEEEEEGSI